MNIKVEERQYMLTIFAGTPKQKEIPLGRKRYYLVFEFDNRKYRFKCKKLKANYAGPTS